MDHVRPFMFSPSARQSIVLPETRYSLIARLARREDMETWEDFVRTYEGAILRYCRSKGLQDADAAEVAQEVFLAVANKAEDWKPSGRSGSFRVWLFETARRNCLKSLRQRVRLQTGNDSATLNQPDHRSAGEAAKHQDQDDWQRWAFYAAAAQVEREVQPQTWQAFWQTAVENREPQAVANELGISVGSVYTAKCRVMARIRKQIEELSLS